MSAFALARRQLANDRELTRRFPKLLDHKRERLLASPHAFLRGSAPLFYQLLQERPELGDGPGGEGPVVGDMHVENLGAYKSDDQKIVFDLNDFDDAAIAPRRFDVLRLATSVILSGRSYAKNARACLQLAEALLDAYVNAAFDLGAEPPAMTPGMVAIVDKASKRSKKDLLEGRTHGPKGHHQFDRGDRYLDLPKDLAELPHIALPIYVAALGARAPKGAKHWEVEDAAQRIAGTGSLGRVRVAVLVIDHDGEERILDFKEAAPASCAPSCGEPLEYAKRVVDAANALLDSSPRLLAPIVVPTFGMSMIGRQLAPQEDKLELARIPHAERELEEIAARVGHILGTAHRRAGWVAPQEPWNAVERAKLIDNALELAGIHESVYLAYARVGS